MRRVIDSNVPIVANGRDTNASTRCREAAIDILALLIARGRIVVDEDGEMLAEYRRYCQPRGQPGVGDRFFREVLMNYSGKIERIHLARTENGNYRDFPDDPELANFDASDRKFAAAARKAGAPVLNATDSDWLIHRRALARNGIAVEFVCGANMDDWTTH
jgi:hypothetical protein